MNLLFDPTTVRLPWLVWLLLFAPVWGRLVLAFLRDWHRYRDERRG
jgi:hypothetical protein